MFTGPSWKRTASPAAKLLKRGMFLLNSSTVCLQIPQIAFWQEKLQPLHCTNTAELRNKNEDRFSPYMSSTSKRISEAFSIFCKKKKSQLNRTPHSESESIVNLGLTERRCRGNVKGLSDLSLLVFEDLLSDMPRSKEATEKGRNEF